MESMGVIDPACWRGRQVLVTGHTGFKGSWLVKWLHMLGAQVSGYSLPPATTPALFDLARVADDCVDLRGDIRDAAAMRDALARTRPSVVFHLAAQPLVRASYADPVATYATNVVGTASLLDAVRAVDSVQAVVCITTDKCYENREWDWAYRENDALGGFDPYSSSKACAELVVNAFRRSYLGTASRATGIATARAGNVIGGGDWSQDRLLPDVVRAATSGVAVAIRNPNSVRPWQHVLEPLGGYLLLAQRLLAAPAEYSGAWNFGPPAEAFATVGDVLDGIARHWPQAGRRVSDGASHPHEAAMLTLDSTKANSRLGWRARLDIDDALRMTAEWYRAYVEGPADMDAATRTQINTYSAMAA